MKRTVTTNQNQDFSNQYLFELCVLTAFLLWVTAVTVGMISGQTGNPDQGIALAQHKENLIFLGGLLFGDAVFLRKLARALKARFWARR
ncbi:hypothetical protein [Marinobacter sp.]|uniref:hypothetical protein n=1 Tax=Marinobacter sp. TaxID=50741 RepID=UPI003569BB8F